MSKTIYEIITIIEVDQDGLVSHKVKSIKELVPPDFNEDDEEDNNDE